MESSQRFDSRIHSGTVNYELRTVNSRAYAQLLLQDAEDFFLAHDQQLFAVDLDLRARILAKQHAIARLHIQRKYFAFVVRLALAHGDHFSLLGFFLRAVRDNDAPADRLA